MMRARKSETLWLESHIYVVYGVHVRYLESKASAVQAQPIDER